MHQRLLFFSKAPMNYLMFRDVASRLAWDRRLGLRLYAEDELGRDLLSVYGPMGISNPQLVGNIRARWWPWDLYISPDTRVVAPRARCKVHIFHGISFKGHAYTDNVKPFDKLFLIGPYQRRAYVERGILPADDSRMVDVGMAKTDRLVNGTIDRTEVLVKLGLPSNRPTVLYAPTWRKEASLEVMGDRIIETVGRMDVNLLVKIHDWSWSTKRTLRDWAAWFRDKEAAGAPWRVVRDPDIVPSLAAADLLISDASSTANEFLLRDRPIIFVDVPDLIQKYSQTIDLDTWGRKTGRMVTDATELPRVIEEELSNPGALSGIRKAAAADYFFNAGNAVDATVKQLYELMGIERADPNKGPDSP